MFWKRLLRLSLCPHLCNFYVRFHSIRKKGNLIIICEEPVDCQVSFGESEMLTLLIPKDSSLFGYEACKCHFKSFQSVFQLYLTFKWDICLVLFLNKDETFEIIYSIAFCSFPRTFKSS